MGGNTTTFEDPRVVDRIERQLARAPIVRVRTEILVHDRWPEPPGPPCPCCGSRVARIVDRQLDLDLLIDRHRGTRVARWRLPAAWLERYDAEATGEHVEDLVIPLRCARAQLPILLATATVILVTGGSRAGKTQIAQTWLGRQILLRGGPDSLFWIMGPDRRAPWIALQKLIFGKNRTPPVLPADPASGDPLLARRWPEQAAGLAAKSLDVVMLDQSKLQIRPLDRKDASRIRGEAIDAGLVEEASAVKHSENLIDAQNRVVDRDGSVLYSTTPDDNLFLEDTIAAAAEEALLAEREGHTPTTVHFTLSRYDNPWISVDAVARAEADLQRKGGQNAVDRQIHGKWIPRGSGRMWIHFDPDRHILPPRQTRTLEKLVDPVTEKPFHDITRAAVRRFFATSNPLRPGLRAGNQDFIGGLDVNKRPITLVIAKVFARDIHKPDEWGLVIVDEVRLPYAETVIHAGRAFRRARGKLYEGITIVVDSTAMWSDTAIRHGRAPTQNGGNENALALCDLGFDARPAQLTAQRKPVNPVRMDSHHLIHELMDGDRLYLAGGRVPQLLKSIEQQQVGPNGLPHKVSNSAGDRLANPIDGLRYLAWRLWGKGRKPAKHRPSWQK